MTSEEATDLMLAVVNATALAYSPAIPMRYLDVPGDPPAENVVWARGSVLHATGGQGSLTGGNGTTLYENKGLLLVEVYAPVGDGKVAGRRAAQAFLNAIRSYRGAVWFRGMHMQEAGRDGAFERFDVKTNFEYDDVR